MADRKEAAPAKVSLARMLDTVLISEVFVGSRVKIEYALDE